MKIRLLKIIFILMILISCNKKIENNTINEAFIVEVVEVVEDEQIISITTDSQDIILSEFNPSYILLNNVVYQQPDIQSSRSWAFLLLDLVEILRYEEQEIINGENIQWVQISRNNRTGWCFITDVKKLEQPIEYNPMNEIDIDYLILNNNSENSRFKIEGINGNYTGTYGINNISIWFNGRNDYYDQYYLYGYGPENFRKMELCIENNIGIFPSIGWGTHQRKNIFNNITVIDTFLFSAHESSNQSVQRIIYFTTNNYDIYISLYIPDSSYENDIIKQIMREAPQYFLLGDRITPYNGEDPNKNVVVWDYFNDAIERFGNDLMDGINPSQTLNLWYSETEKILESLRIE